MIASISSTVLGQFRERLTGAISVMRMLSSILIPMPRYFLSTDVSWLCMYIPAEQIDHKQGQASLQDELCLGQRQ